MQETISLNNIRNNISLLLKPLGEITKNIKDNINKCEIQKEKVEQWKGDIDELKQNLYTPMLDIVTTPLEMPITVCGEMECCEKRAVNGSMKVHYKKPCHEPCYLKYDDNNVLGNKGLLDCKAFNTYIDDGPWKHLPRANIVPDSLLPAQLPEDELVWVQPIKRVKSEICNVCNHSYQSHLHISYKTDIVLAEIRDEASYVKITTREEAIMAQEKQISDLQSRIVELKDEFKEITKISANFACFLKSNAIATYNDVFENYLNYLIKQRKEINDMQENKIEIDQLEQMLDDYRREKEVFENIDEEAKYEIIKPEVIDIYLNILCKLKHSGPKIVESLKFQQKIQINIHQSSNEVRHIVEKPKSKFRKFLNLIFDEITDPYVNEMLNYNNDQ